MLVDANDDVLIVDRMNMRVTRFSERGARMEMQGKKLPFASYKLQPTKRGSFPERAAWILNGPGWRFVATLRSSSRGLFALQDGSLVHFTTQFEGKDELDDSIFGVEVFDPNGAFIGSGPVQNMESFDKDERSIIEVLWCDKEDRFYLTDHCSGFPVLRVMRLEYEVED